MKPKQKRLVVWMDADWQNWIRIDACSCDFPPCRKHKVGDYNIKVAITIEEIPNVKRI